MKTIKYWYYRFKFWLTSFWRPKVNRIDKLMDDNNLGGEDSLEFDLPDPMELKPLIFPDVPRTFVATPEVRLYSYYFKKAGANQDLRYGDWYFVLENGIPLTKVYHKNDVNSYDDFQFISSKNYIRLITQEEAFNIVRVLGFMFDEESPTMPVDFDFMTGQTTVRIFEPKSSISIEATASNPHGAWVKVAFLAYSQTKHLNDYTSQLLKEGWIKPNEESQS